MTDHPGSDQPGSGQPTGDEEGRSRANRSAGDPAARRRPDGAAGRSSSGPRGGRPTRSGAPRAVAGSGLQDQRTVRPMGPRRDAPVEPRIPDDVSAAELDRSVRGELRSLSKANAEVVGRHLVMIGRLMHEDPQAAYAHAMAAQRRAGRIAAVREAVGVAAYHAGLWEIGRAHV